MQSANIAVKAGNVEGMGKRLSGLVFPVHWRRSLSDHFKSGQRLSLQNRPREGAGTFMFYPVIPVKASPI